MRVWRRLVQPVDNNTRRILTAQFTRVKRTDMEAELTYVAFSGPRCVAEGALRDVLPLLKRRFDADRGELVLVFEVETGKQVDFALEGTLEAILEREVPSAPRGPGRPKLGVISREVSLLPKHWDWLEHQPGGISGALRRLVDQAIKKEPERERARRRRDALSRILTAIAGDRPHFEDAMRALFAGEQARFEELVARWPKDIRELATRPQVEGAA